MRRQFQYYDLILTLFATILLVSNLAAIKLIAFGPIIGDGGAILFPLAYILDDVLTEVYGYKHARRAIWTAFSIMIIAVIALTIVRYLPSATEWHNQDAYVSILGFFPRIVVASLTAFVVGEFINSVVLAKLKIRYGGKKLWLRLVGSTAIGELVDTTVFGLIAFLGILTAHDMLIYLVVGWGFKLTVEVMFLPISYRVIHWLKVREKIDYYDRKTDFTPFSLQLKD